MKDYFLTLARYNAWATRTLLEQVDALSDEDYRRDVGLFFKSVHGTLNHLLVGEHLVWYPRFAEGVSNLQALDEEVEPDRRALRERLVGLAARWQPFIASLPEERWGGTLDYRSTKGVPQSMPVAAALGHVFNHGTHHRGQITAALTALGQPCPVLDLVAMLLLEART